MGQESHMSYVGQIDKHIKLSPEATRKIATETSVARDLVAGEARRIFRARQKGGEVKAPVESLSQADTMLFNLGAMLSEKTMDPKNLPTEYRWFRTVDYNGAGYSDAVAKERGMMFSSGESLPRLMRTADGTYAPLYDARPGEGLAPLPSDKGKPSKLRSGEIELRAHVGNSEDGMIFMAYEGQSDPSNPDTVKQNLIFVKVDKSLFIDAYMTALAPDMAKDFVTREEQETKNKSKPTPKEAAVRHIVSTYNRSREDRGSEHFMRPREVAPRVKDEDMKKLLESGELIKRVTMLEYLKGYMDGIANEGGLLPDEAEYEKKARENILERKKSEQKKPPASMDGGEDGAQATQEEIEITDEELGQEIAKVKRVVTQDALKGLDASRRAQYKKLVGLKEELEKAGTETITSKEIRAVLVAIYGHQLEETKSDMLIKISELEGLMNSSAEGSKEKESYRAQLNKARKELGILNDIGALAFDSEVTRVAEAIASGDVEDDELAQALKDAFTDPDAKSGAKLKDFLKSYAEKRIKDLPQEKQDFWKKMFDKYGPWAGMFLMMMLKQLIDQGAAASRPTK